MTQVASLLWLLGHMGQETSEVDEVMKSENIMKF